MRLQPEFSYFSSCELQFLPKSRWLVGLPLCQLWDWAQDILPEKVPYCLSRADTPLLSSDVRSAAVAMLCVVAWGREGGKT